MSNPLVGSTTIDPDEYFKTDPGIPFHLLRRKKAAQPPSLLSMSTNLQGLDEAFAKFSKQNIKDGLSSFLPDLPGYVDAPGTPQDSLQSLIDKPPIGGREILPLNDSALQGFRLMPGSVPDHLKFMNKPPERRFLTTLGSRPLEVHEQTP
uniref:Mediator of RNA polymerase II transcription subunit 19 n=1 Tax=Clytia hemisphaerica TaxID=252671 RepID=A0A7M5WIQ6_9CNID